VSFPIDRALAVLRREARQWPVPAVGVVAGERPDPFLVLISTLISLRTKDKVTAEASARLFAKARDPKSLAALDLRTIERAIYPASFFRVKARTLKGAARELLERYGGRVPDGVDELCTIKGVGRKTANLVVTLGHAKPGICVDTHVHRISNLWGYVRTKTPDDTETALRRKLPRRHWMTFNDLLVAFGQNLCVPVSPWCSRCPLDSFCPRVGLKHHR
jgi:endonuclease-3